MRKKGKELQSLPSIDIAAMATSLGGNKARIHGDSAQTVCPAHNDKGPSLRITRAGDKILVHCHAGCSQEAVLSALEDKGYSLKNVKRTDVKKKYKSKNLTDLYDEPGLQFVKSYIYYHADGKPNYASVRLFDSDAGEKTFRQATFVDGWWVKGTKAIGHYVLYNYAAVIEAIKKGETVYMMEGEKDADTMIRLGFVATCIIAGAGKNKWRDVYTQQLQGVKKLVQFIDNDWAGYEFCQTVAKAVKVLDLPYVWAVPPVGHKKDTSDFVADYPEDMQADMMKALEEEAQPMTDSFENPWPSPNAKNKSEDGEPTEDKVVAIRKDDPDIILEYDAQYYSETGSARRVAQSVGKDIAYSMGKWWCYEDGIYVVDEDKVVRTTQEVLETFLEDKPKGISVRNHQRHVTVCLSKRGIANVMDLAKREYPIKTDPTLFDSQEHLICVKNGVVNLRTKELLPHSKEFKNTRMADVEYHPDREDKTDSWDLFVNQSSNFDEELVGFLHRLGGYLCSGDISAHKAFMFHGPGRNGKSVFLNIVRRILGSYAGNIRSEAFMTSYDNASPMDNFCQVVGLRAIIAGEISSNAKLDEKKVKKFTGGEPIEARFLYAQPFFFVPDGKPIFSTNYLPTVKDQDYAIWERLVIIPFTVVVPPEERIPNLENLLFEKERNGIFKKFVQGAYENYQELDRRNAGVFSNDITHLKIPARCLHETENYQKSQDIVEHFLAEALTENEFGKLLMRDIFAAFQLYCKESGERCRFTAMTLGKELSKKGLKSERTGFGKQYEGFVLNEHYHQFVNHRKPQQLSFK